MAKRFDPTTYNPLTDSTPHSEGYRDALNDDGDADLVSQVVIVVNDGATRTCACGCLGEVAKGSKFRQGHDARLKGILIRAHLAGKEMAVVDGTLLGCSPMAYAESLGWEQFLVAAEQRHADKAPAKIKVVRAKVGRWVYSGVVSSDGARFVYTNKKGEEVVADQFTLV